MDDVYAGTICHSPVGLRVFHFTFLLLAHMVLTSYSNWGLGLELEDAVRYDGNGTDSTGGGVIGVC